MRNVKKTRKRQKKKTQKKYNQKGGAIVPILSDNSSYNDNLYVRESHNCYTYFLNLKSDDSVKLCKNDYSKYNMCRRAQPGYFKGYPKLNKNDYKCPIMMRRTLDDNPNISKTTQKKSCPSNYYKGALVVAPGRDYHYYRLNDDNVWTHKPGYKPSTHLDANNNIIIDPKKANRNYGGTLNYKDFCGFMCVPKDSDLKRMSHYDEDKNNPNNRKNSTIKNNNYRNYKRFKNFKNYKDYRNFKNFKTMKKRNN